MSRTFKIIMAGLIAGTFLLGAPPAHALFGIRVARKAIAARKARQVLAGDPNAEATAKANENLRRLEEGSEKV
ncbi:MAG: hypothetical protein PHV97_01825 [Candidatus Omnitrophica bacterium]|nr:hypothetical protein [Candidatus Omnitrophota bacterium]